MEHRAAVMQRTTKETDIALSLKLDGTGMGEIHTGIGFFDHMLRGFARHGLFDLTCQVKGDLEVDCHHTVEDTGIVLGQAILKAVGDKPGSGDTDILSFRWTRRLSYVRWISREDRILSLTLHLPRNALEGWIQRW